MDELLFQRASQIYLWAMPLINTMGMKVGSEEKFGAGYHVRKTNRDPGELTTFGQFAW